MTRSAREHVAEDAGVGVQRDQAEDGDGSRGLTAALAQHVDQGLGGRPDLLRHRHVQKLGGRAVQRVLERAIHGLDRDRGDEPPGDREAERSPKEDDGENRDRRGEAQLSDEPADQADLNHQRPDVEREVNGREDGSHLLRLDVRVDGALEHEVRQRQRHRGEQHDDGHALGVRRCPQHGDALADGSARALLLGAVSHQPLVDVFDEAGLGALGVVALPSAEQT